MKLNSIALLTASSLFFAACGSDKTETKVPETPTDVATTDVAPTDVAQGSHVNGSITSLLLQSSSNRPEYA